MSTVYTICRKKRSAIRPRSGGKIVGSKKVTGKDRNVDVIYIPLIWGQKWQNVIFGPKSKMAAFWSRFTPYVETIFKISPRFCPQDVFRNFLGGHGAFLKD